MLRQVVNILRDIENIDNKVGADWLGFMVLCPKEHLGAEIDELPPHADFLVMEQALADRPRQYITKCL